MSAYGPPPATSPMAAQPASPAPTTRRCQSARRYGVPAEPLEREPVLLQLALDRFAIVLAQMLVLEHDEPYAVAIQVDGIDDGPLVAFRIDDDDIHGASGQQVGHLLEGYRPHALRGQLELDMR